MPEQNFSDFNPTVVEEATRRSMAGVTYLHGAEVLRPDQHAEVLAEQADVAVALQLTSEVLRARDNFVKKVA